MFKKMRIKRKIKSCIKQITRIEKQRYRSQAAIVEAILSSTQPDDTDVDYFNTYTSQIDAVRADVHRLKAELEKL